MEVSLFNCLPHVPSPEKLESCETNSLILVASAPVVSRKEIQFGASTSFRSIKPKPPLHDGDLFERSTKDGCDNLTLSPNRELPCGSKMRAKAEDLDPNSAPVAPEVATHINGRISEENVPCIYPLCIGESDMSESVDKVSLEACAENTSSVDSPKRKKRYLFNFRPNLGKILVKTKGGDSFKCYTCGGIYRQKFSLKRHFLRTHIDYRYISEADIANCKIPVPNYITQHSSAENTANGRKKYRKSSDDVFLDNNDSGLLPGLYRCHDCINVSFDTDAELREHYNKHPDSIKKKYECGICQASFIKKQILSRHLAGHEGKKIKLICKKCNLDFSSKEELDQHLTSHSSGKTCRFCQKILSNVANRKRHELLHLNSAKRCPHCHQCFAQRKELELHIKSQHSEVNHTCNVCNQSCSSAESLAVHMKEKHRSSPKLPESTNEPEQVPKPKPTRVCFVCKRVFPTVYAMLKHRRNAHPFHSRRKRHKKTAKAKSVISNRDNTTNEYKKTYIRPVGRPKGSGKKMSVGDSMRYVEKRDRVFMRRARREEIEFYSKVHENIAYNLTNCIEGKASQLSLKEYNFSDLQQFSEDFEKRVKLPWEFYNFPSFYDVSNVLKVKGHEIKRPENLSVADEFLQNATGLTPANPSIQPCDKTKQSTDSTNELPSNECMIFSKTDEKVKLTAKQIISVLFCHVCKKGFDSLETFTSHSMNNHHNVECSYVELFGDKDFPPTIPPEMCSYVVSPVGFRFAYDVPPVFHNAPVTCTKCRKTFQTVLELHDHMVECGNLNAKSRPRFKIPLSPKHSMRRRMTVAQWRSGFNNRSGTTPEKMKKQGFVKKLTKKSFSDKTPRSEKLLFYKNDRMQPKKSFTVDKNYFATKPKPVKSGLSKRGRKSYEEKSLAYRYAGMQASTSRECPHCRIVFASMQLLNNHTKSCSQLSAKKSNSAVASNSASKSATKDSAIVTTAGKKTGSEPASNSAVCNLTTLFNFPSSSSSGEDLSYSLEISKNSSRCSSRRSSVTELPNTPIDLSRNCSESKGSAKLNNQTKNCTAKSALEIAMEAVQKHLTEMPDNEPILKVQKTTKKTDATKVTTESPLVSPVLKSGSGKKVGRPRKLKKETSTPIPAQKVLFHNSPGEKKSPSKPKKLEDIVKGIKESIGQIEENRLQKNDPPEQTSVSDNKAAIITSPAPNVAETDLPKSNQKADNKSLDKAIVADKNVEQNIPLKLNAFAANTSKLNNSSDSSNKCSSNSDSNKISPKIIELPAAKLPEKAQALDVVSREAVINKPNVEAVCSSELPKMPHEIKVTKITLPCPSLDINIPEKTDAQDASSHGRNSPTSEFEGLLKSINQRLLSEDKNQQDDSAIPWLEDEKFEIPPSRTSLNVIVNSNVEKTAVNAGTCVIPPILSTSKIASNDEQHSSPLSEQVLPTVPQGLEIKPITVNNDDREKEALINTKVPEKVEQKIIKEKPKEEISIKPVFHNAVVPKSTKTQETVKTVLTAETTISSLSNKSSSALKSAKNEIKPSYRKSISETSKSLPTSPERKVVSKTAKPTVNSSEKRRPGRPRKNQVDFYAESSKAVSTHSSTANAKVTANKSLRNSVTVETNASLKSSDTSLQNSASNVSLTDRKRKSSASLLDTVSLPKGTSITKSSENVPKNDKTVNQTSNEPETSESQKNSNSKLKPGNDGESDNLKTLFKPITTEFGKNLASKMKEKMRLSLEQDLPKNGLSVDDPNNSNCGSENSETNSLVSTEEKLVKVIKKECEISENKKIHSCPHCMLEFAYLTNFRRHIKQCKARDQAKEMEPPPGTQTNLQHLPKKDEVDYCMLNLYRFQSRQTDMLKEDESVNKHFKTYECNICHKIYMNLFNLMQHKLSSHKLVEQNNPGCSSEISDMNILSLAGQLTPESPHPENNSTRTVVVESNRLKQLSNILEKYQKLDESENANDEIQPSKLESSSKKSEDQLVEDEENKSVKSKGSDIKSKKQSDNLDGHSGKLDNKTNADEAATVKENGKMDVSSDAPNDTDLDMKSTSESSPAKKKRGRPVGWRKNPEVVKEVVVKNKKIKADNKNEKALLKKSLLVLKKKDKMNQSGTKLKSPTKRIILENLKKVIAKKKSRNLSNEEKPTTECTSVKDIPDEAVNTSDCKSVIPEEALKNVPKRSSAKNTTESEKILDTPKDASEIKSAKLSGKSSAETDASVTVKERNSPKPVTVKNSSKLFEKPATKIETPGVKDNGITKQNSIKTSLKFSEKSVTKTVVKTDDKEQTVTKQSSGKTSVKLPEKSVIKTEPNLDVKESYVKRGRGRLPWKNVVTHTKKIVSKSEALQRRKPGRPPKNAFSLSNPQTVKAAIASSSSTKNPKRGPAQMYPIHVNDNSSDSDSNDAKNDAPVKKKINPKCCVLCSDKFASNLELKRHIQLKHNRKKTDDDKSDIQMKILKGIDTKSSFLDLPECKSDILQDRCDSPQRKTPSRKSDPTKSNRTAQVRKNDSSPKTVPSLQKSPSLDAVKSEKDVSPKRSDTPPKKNEVPKNLKICAICKQKFATGPLLHQHLQMFHNRKSESAAIIPDQSSTPGRKSLPAAVVPDQSPTPGRKSLPAAVVSDQSPTPGRKSLPAVINPEQSPSPGRKSLPAATKSSPSSASPSPVRKKKELTFDRKTLSRQCRKPLPPLKRQRILKKEPLEQIPKKTKL